MVTITTSSELPQSISEVKDFLEETLPFISARRAQSLWGHSLHLLGFAYDGTTSFRPGSRFGPHAIRDVSTNLETYSPYLHRDLADYSLIDLGNLPFHPHRYDLMNQYFDELLSGISLKKYHSKLLVIGGEHSISYAPIKYHLNEYPDLLLLHLDAHADLRDGYLGAAFSHASIIRRVLDHFGPHHQLLQYGIRSGTREEFQWMKEHHTLIDSFSKLIDQLEKIPQERPIYLTLDLDFFDPSYFPGTGTPEAGGEDFHHFIKIIKVLREKNFIGADITELAPHYDPSGQSSCLASKVTREILLAMS
jgi:agmatinase